MEKQLNVYAWYDKPFSIFFIAKINSLPFPDSSNRIDKLKIFDFQLTAYYSFTCDLIFFLFSSVNEHDRSEHIESFFKHYHHHFYETLKKLGCSLDEYTYEKFVLLNILFSHFFFL